jgi:hypothetical protein
MVTEKELVAEQTVTDQVCLVLILSKYSYSRQVFRDESGKPNLNSEAGLHLSLKDFVPEALVEDKDLQGHIFIPS